MPRWYPCKCCTGLMAAVFENFGPTMNHWNYCYCVTPTQQEGQPPSPWSFQFVSPNSYNASFDPDLYSFVYKPYQPKLEYGYTTTRAASRALIRLEFGEQYTRLQVVFYNLFSVSSGDMSGEGSIDYPDLGDWYLSPGVKWTHTVTYRIAAEDYPRATASGVFRFRKADIIEQTHAGDTEITHLERSLPNHLQFDPFIGHIGVSWWGPPAPSRAYTMQTNVPADIGDVVIAHPIYRHNLHSRDLSLQFTATAATEQGQAGTYDNRTAEYDVSELTAEPFEFLAPGAEIVGRPWTDSVPSVPAGGCEGNGSAGVTDSLVAIDRRAVSPTLATKINFPSTTAVKLFARGTKTIDGQCRSGDGFNSRYDRPLLEFVVTDYHWSALAVDNVLHATLGAGDTTPFWQPGWSRPALNPGGFTLTNLNPEENPERL